MRRKLSIIAALLFCCLAVTVAIPQTKRSAGGQRERSGKEVYTGTIVAMGGRFPGSTATFTLTLEGYTSDADAQRFVQILKSNGQDALLEAIRKEKLGNFQIGSRVGRDINVARSTETEEGRKITLVFERWLEFFELRYGTRSRDYPFTYVELYIDDAKGKGEGAMIPAARIEFDEGRIEIENFGAWPARLMGVDRRGN